MSLKIDAIFPMGSIGLRHVKLVWLRHFVNHFVRALPYPQTIITNFCNFNEYAKAYYINKDTTCIQIGCTRNTQSSNVIKIKISI